MGLRHDFSVNCNEFSGSRLLCTPSLPPSQRYNNWGETKCTIASTFKFFPCLPVPWTFWFVDLHSCFAYNSAHQLKRPQIGEAASGVFLCVAKISPLSSNVANPKGLDIPIPTDYKYFLLPSLPITLMRALKSLYYVISVTSFAIRTCWFMHWRDPLACETIHHAEMLTFNRPCALSGYSNKPVLFSFRTSMSLK